MSCNFFFNNIGKKRRKNISNKNTYEKFPVIFEFLIMQVDLYKNLNVIMSSI